MIERAIENWLINTNERNYQVPFCQVLLQKGHKVIYFSSHRPMEQGKDIITIDGDGEYCSYQLKTGDIDLAVWRNISGEIRELIELPIIHPSVDKSKIHKSFLVTNGEIKDEVRIQIDNINEDNQRKKRNYSYLNVINGKTLLKEFIDVQGEFIPKELGDFSLFLELFLSDGADFFLKEKFFNFLNNTIFNEKPKQKSNAINAISSSIVITAYLLKPYQNKNNYYALFEAWTSLAASVVRYAYVADLKKEDWANSFSLIMSEIIRNLFFLKEETLERKDFIEGDWRVDGGDIYRARATIVLGALAMLENYQRKTNKEYVRDERLLPLIINSKINILWLWGESSFPYFFHLIKYLENNNQVRIAQLLLNTFLEAIIKNNSPRNDIGLANLYFSPNDVLESLFGINQEKIDFREFRGSSYLLEIFILMLTRRGERDLLEKNWRRLSYIQIKEFVPDKVEDIFTWRTKKGLNHSKFPQATQSWTELVKEANDISGTPNFFKEYIDLLQLFILVCPHRVNKTIIGLLDRNQ